MTQQKQQHERKPLFLDTSLKIQLQRGIRKQEATVCCRRGAPLAMLFQQCYKRGPLPTLAATRLRFPGPSENVCQLRFAC